MGSFVQKLIELTYDRGRKKGRFNTELPEVNSKRFQARKKGSQMGNDHFSDL
jgi:hypothetical protein